MPVRQKQKTETKDFRISILTPYGEVSRDFNTREVFSIRHVAIAVKTFTIPKYSGGFEDVPGIVSKFWCICNDPQFSELWLARKIGENPFYRQYGLDMRLRDLKIASYQVTPNHIFQIQSSEFLTKIDICLRRLRLAGKPFGVKEIASAAGYTVSEINSAIEADPFLKGKVSSAIQLCMEGSQCHV